MLPVADKSALTSEEENVHRKLLAVALLVLFTTLLITDGSMPNLDLHAGLDVVAVHGRAESASAAPNTGRAADLMRAVFSVAALLAAGITFVDGGRLASRGPVRPRSLAWANFLGQRGPPAPARPSTCA